MPSKLHQVPISWKTKPTGTCRYRLNTEWAFIWPCNELEKKYWQATTVTNAAGFPLLWPGVLLRTERQPRHGLQLRWAQIQAKMLLPWHTQFSACSPGLHPMLVKQSIPQQWPSPCRWAGTLGYLHIHMLRAAAPCPQGNSLGPCLGTRGLTVGS